jgi:hypothetical protein
MAVKRCLIERKCHGRVPGVSLTAIRVKLSSQLAQD